MSRPTPAAPLAASAHRPLTLDQARITGGPLAEWQRRNAEATLPHAIAQLEEWGSIDNFRIAAGESDAGHRGPVFIDSDVHKTIEAVAWEIGRSGTTAFDAWLDEVIALMARAQAGDGYLDTWIQVVEPEARWRRMEHNHEFYVLGHLIQAAVALDRASGRRDLLAIALRFTDLVDDLFGPGRGEAICGHPEIETALVELYRHTGEARYLALSRRMIDLRGHRSLPSGRLGHEYLQDHAPVRESRDAVGHAVRQLYLDAGATDVHLETGEVALLAAMDAQWAGVHERKMYLTGAYGSRQDGEAFGDDHELPSDLAYAETCATIADLHWTWRMLLAGGAAGTAAYAAVMEREIRNALAASIDATGTRFFYANPLQLRADRRSGAHTTRDRVPWFDCACCPPNIARTVAQLGAYLASVSGDTLYLHQFADADVALPTWLGEGSVGVRTRYPADGRIAIEVTGAPVPDAVLAVRVPAWSASAVLSAPDGEHGADADGYVRAPLVAGAYHLELDLTPRFTRAHHRVDALRGCVAVERGPVVYCAEQVDLPDGVAIDDLVVLTSRGVIEDADGALSVRARVMCGEPGLYAPLSAAGTQTSASEIDVRLLPFADWGNRGSVAMRVWLPAEVGQRAEA